MRATIAGIVRISAKSLLLALAIVSASPVAYAQTDSDLLSLKSSDFEKAIQALASANQGIGNPSTFCQAVPDRLKTDRYVYDKTVLRCVEAWIAWEERLPLQTPAKATFSASFRFMNDVLSVLPDDRTVLKSKIIARQGSLFMRLNDFSHAVEQLATASALIDIPHLDADKERLSTLVKLGEALLLSDKKKEAEDQFLIALSYPFYAVLNHPQEEQDLRQLYEAAGRGLIDARRNNLAALKQIVFVPAAEPELTPVLKQAIREAESNTDRQQNQR